MEELKTSSSKWLKTQSSELSTFAWQRGYGVFSAGPKQQNTLVHYIETQEEHHQQRSFQDEYRDLLSQHRMTCGERYVWG